MRPTPSPLQEIRILGVPVTTAVAPKALETVIHACRSSKEPVSVAFANAHAVNLATSDAGYRAVLQGFSFVFNDGAGLAIAARIKGHRLPENLNGSDFTPKLLRAVAGSGWPVFLLGARPGIARQAAENLVRDIPGLQIAGTHDGYFPRARSAEVARAVRASGAEVIMVALGNPAQEHWLAEHLASTGVRLGVAVGAFLDYSSNRTRRAPRWMTDHGVEWVYRLIREPRRMWRRYLLGGPLFLARTVREEFALRRREAGRPAERLSGAGPTRRLESSA